MSQAQNEHVPVLLESVLEYLTPKTGESYLDLTAGYGGHAKAVLERTRAPQATTLVDRDARAVQALESLRDSGVTIIQSDFLSVVDNFAKQQRSFDMILLDLGISSPHVDNPERGFSIRGDGPLDMRMDQSQGLTAFTVVNSYSKDQLQDIFQDYGEEPRAARVAEAITQQRPVNTTSELAEIVRKALPGPRKRVHPATKVFQAIRIAVNDELHQIKRVLPLAVDILNPGGRLAVISFHSLEDRIVKQFLKEESASGYESRVEVLTKKPISGEIDDVSNPRARSAKLRVACKKPR